MVKSANIKIACGIAAAAAMLSSTAAMAAEPVSYSPLVALSMVAAPQSQAALCATGTADATAAAEATTAQAQPVQGCVLPVPDAAVTPLPQQVFDVPNRFSPLLIGIGAIGLGVLLYALLHKDKDEAPPAPESPM